MNAQATLITPEHIAEFQQAGATCVRRAFCDWVEPLRQGIDENLKHPGPYFAENTKEDEQGRFWDDYCNWQRIAGFSDFLLKSEAAQLAASIMGSNTAQLFHDHILVKEPNTATSTPWHQDSPYYFVDGQQTVSIWMPLDSVEQGNTLYFISGSHKWQKPVKPVKWLSGESFYDDHKSDQKLSQTGDEGEEQEYQPLPDQHHLDANQALRGWAMQPGDAVFFHFKTMHGAKGNSGSARRRAFSSRWLGDDVRYIERPGRTSPPFPGHGMHNGERLREDWFPIVWPRSG